jgi:hypothetical protein
MMKFFILVFACAICLGVSDGEIGGGRAQPPGSIPWWSINGGGGLREVSASHRLSSSVGQSIAGVATGADYTMHVGFWNRVVTRVGVEEIRIEHIPIAHSISQNYPNPFHATTTIRYGMPKSEPVRVEVFNIAGQSVRVLVNEAQSPGYKLLRWDGRDETGMKLGCGVYFYRITTPEYEATRKMLLLR